MRYRVLFITVVGCLGCGHSVQQDVAAHSERIPLSGELKTDSREQQFALASLRKRGIVEYSRNASFVKGKSGIILDFEDVNPTDADLTFLRQIPDLRELDFGKMAKRMGPTNKQLVHLKDLAQLRSLCLNNTFVTDEGLVHIMPLRNLEFLDLSYTPVTYEGLIPLIRSMPKLKWLYIEENWQITLEQVQELQRLRPGCEVVR